uniref:Uncharacterized protein n=1 Tax=Arundo donax TaxID=35708 RepID=A0A0A9GZ04_ARUDO
MLPMNQSVWN